MMVDLNNLMVKDFVTLFGMNDKSIVTIYDYAKDKIIFEDRVDYLQSPYNDLHDYIRESIIDHLDVNGGTLFIFINDHVEEV